MKREAAASHESRGVLQNEQCPSIVQQEAYTLYAQHLWVNFYLARRPRPNPTPNLTLTPRLTPTLSGARGRQAGSGAVAWLHRVFRRRFNTNKKNKRQAERPVSTNHSQ